MSLGFDAIHVVGYLGALGSLVFGSNQLRVILQHHSAKDVGVFDYGVRVVYSVLLGIYAIGTGDLVFVVVNFGAALLSLAVAVAAFTMKEKQGDVGRPGSPAEGPASTR
jgi:lipid-A-disaccharide synthase-like uncharacterized protein